jgi:hypothetical protein
LQLFEAPALLHVLLHAGASSIIDRGSKAGSNADFTARDKAEITNFLLHSGPVLVDITILAPDFDYNASGRLSGRFLST